MGRVERIVMRQRRRTILGNVQQQIAAQRHVDQLHAGANAEHRHPPVGDQPHQSAIEQLAAIGQQPNRRVEHPAVAARIEVGPADQHDAVDLVEQLLQVVIVGQRGNDDRNSSRPC